MGVAPLTSRRTQSGAANRSRCRVAAPASRRDFDRPEGRVADEGRRPLRAARPRRRGRDRRHRHGGRRHVPRLGDHQPVHRRGVDGRRLRILGAAVGSLRSRVRQRPGARHHDGGRRARGRARRTARVPAAADVVAPRQAGRLARHPAGAAGHDAAVVRRRATADPERVPRPDRRGVRQLDPGQPVLDGRRRGADRPGARRPVPLDPVRAGHPGRGGERGHRDAEGPVAQSALDGQHACSPRRSPGRWASSPPRSPRPTR